ncbi:polysaccharide biosynthesis/export family protein [Parapedobacter koreensis]|uniref:Polysaccharide export outer membrane protein n=1 Tax=Parapedobacter koreensis TaxID=332977 RepID=A0A1H7NQR6_9SPHI|nr:polysaccharide biosynthesis/export family protein [Parapedobacter koreensis]SEL25674.1 polysaccharide export outer membrane protein [Parapedobacter koreensis]
MVNRRITIGLLYLCVLAGLSSCVSRKEIVYFGNIPIDDPRVKLPDYQEPLIQVDDILHVTVQTIDGGLAMATNQPSGGIVGATSSTSSTTSSVPAGYLVDTDGQITIPMLGRFNVAGLTTSEVREQVTEAASKYFKDPTVQVRFANFKITVIGEVAQPATYTVPSEKVTLLDAIGMAGDLTLFGKRENVLLIRDNNGQKEFVRLNLTTYETFSSPYFYLKQNDVIYVEPGKGRLAALNNTPRQIVAITASIVSLVSVILFRFL